MRVLFLDIDGVLNSHRYYESVERLNSLPPGESHLDPKAIAALQQIVDASGAKIVISSTWRKFFSIDDLRQILAARGLKAGIIGMTPWGNHHRVRGSEILEWLQDHRNEPINGVLVLDDDTDMGPMEPWAFNTEYSVGLTQEQVPMALKILEKPFDYSREFPNDYPWFASTMPGEEPEE